MLQLRFHLYERVHLHNSNLKKWSSAVMPGSHRYIMQELFFLIEWEAFWLLMKLIRLQTSKKGNRCLNRDNVSRFFSEYCKILISRIDYAHFQIYMLIFTHKKVKLTSMCNKCIFICKLMLYNGESIRITWKILHPVTRSLKMYSYIRWLLFA